MAKGYTHGAFRRSFKGFYAAGAVRSAGRLPTLSPRKKAETPLRLCFLYHIVALPLRQIPATIRLQVWWGFWVCGGHGTVDGDWFLAWPCRPLQPWAGFVAWCQVWCQPWTYQS